MEATKHRVLDMAAGRAVRGRARRATLLILDIWGGGRTRSRPGDPRPRPPAGGQQLQGGHGAYEFGGELPDDLAHRSRTRAFRMGRPVWLSSPGRRAPRDPRAPTAQPVRALR